MKYALTKDACGQAGMAPAGREVKPMISYIKGILTETEPDNVVIETGGIGYNIKITDRVLSSLPPVGREAKLYTHFHVREDAMQLYRFLSREDLNMFRMLLNVNGVGPKVALSLINEMSANDLAFAILADDVTAISKAPGLGKKTAQKIVLELKDKMDLNEAFEARSNAAASAVTAVDSDMTEAIEALVALGYSSTEAVRAVKGIEGAEGMASETLLKEALKKLAGF